MPRPEAGLRGGSAQGRRGERQPGLRLLPLRREERRLSPTPGAQEATTTAACSQGKARGGRGGSIPPSGRLSFRGRSRAAREVHSGGGGGATVPARAQRSLLGWPCCWAETAP